MVCFNAAHGIGLVVSESGQAAEGWHSCPNLFRMATRPWHVEASAERVLVYFISEGRRGLRRWEYRTNRSQRLGRTETFLAFSITKDCRRLCAVTASHRVSLRSRRHGAALEPLCGRAGATAVLSHVCGLEGGG